MCMNSWGRDWGEAGLFRMERGKNKCKMEDFILAVWGNVLGRKIEGFPDIDRLVAARREERLLREREELERLRDRQSLREMRVRRRMQLLRERDRNRVNGHRIRHYRSRVANHQQWPNIDMDFRSYV